MNETVRPGDVERFLDAISLRLGLQFDEAKHVFLTEVLRRRLESTGMPSHLYLKRLDTETSSEEIRALARELTVGETYFFRHSDQFRAFAEVALADRIKVQRDEKRIRIASLGCASGEEAYSLAILVHELGLHPSWEVSIVGVDVNPAAIEVAGRARYSPWAFRETPVGIQRRWFRLQGKEMVLDQSIRAAVRFEEDNLADDAGVLWLDPGYDIVLCRNVIMYFTRESGASLVARITRAIAPGGYLFLGHAETLRGLSQNFHLRQSHGCFYYQRRERVAEPAPPISISLPAGAPQTAVVESADTWLETILRASERIEQLSRPSPQGALPKAGHRPQTARPVWDSVPVLDLVRRERFKEALDMVMELPAESARDPDILLLKGSLLTHSGQLPHAEEVCRTMLEVDEMNAGAHYLLALCREGAGDLPGARGHDEMAAYLDPDFAMPRLHLGLLERRAADHDAAVRNLAQALALLQREDTSRLLLFGGGFSREALTALCRAELEGCMAKL